MKNLLNLKRLINAALPNKATLSREAPNNTQILREFKRINAHETTCVQLWALKRFQQLQTSHIINTWGKLNSSLTMNSNNADVLDMLKYHNLTKATIDIEKAHNVIITLCVEENFNKSTTIVIALSIEKETDNCVLQILITTTFKTYAK
jgi:hypothetical protein